MVIKGGKILKSVQVRLHEERRYVIDENTVYG